MIKSFVKSVLRGLAILIVSPLLLTHKLSSLVTSPDHSIESHSQFLSLLPGTFGNYLRVAFYRQTLEYCHPSATICFGTLFSKTGARIEEHVYIGPNCMIGLATIRSDVLIGPAVQIPSGPLTHGITRIDLPIRLQVGEQKRVTIERDCWIGCNSVVLTDLHEGCVIGAHSVITQPTDAFSIYAGCPAKKIRNR